MVEEGGSRIRYQPYYCEENIWHLAQDLGVEDAYVVVITNQAGAVLFWGQRSCDDEFTPILWDYHVILIKKQASHWHVWDLDSQLSQPTALERYLPYTFYRVGWYMRKFAPLFRVVTAQDYVQVFCSDRSHMKENEEGATFARPVPPWPKIQPPGQEGTNLHRFCDPNDEFVGEVMDYSMLLQVFLEQESAMSE